MKSRLVKSMIAGLGCAAMLAMVAPASAQQLLGYKPHTGEVVERSARPAVTNEDAVVRSLTRTGLSYELIFADVDAGTGVGFDDATEGAARRQVAEDVLAYVASVLDHPDGEVIVYFDPSLTSGTGALASAGTFYNVEPGVQVATSIQRIVDGVPPFDDGQGGDLEDIFVEVNFGYNYYAGAGTPGAGEIDLFSVLLHEVTHGLGFASLTLEDGNSIFFDGGGNPAQTRSGLDAVMFTANGDKMFNDNTGAILQPVSWLTGSPGALQHRGAEVVAEQGANGENLHTPATFAEGTSLSHWDTLISGVMLPTFAPTETRREYLEAELAALRDLGYTIAEDEPTSVEEWQSHE